MHKRQISCYSKSVHYAILVWIILYSGEVQHATQKLTLQYMHDPCCLRLQIVTYINPFQYF